MAHGNSHATFPSAGVPGHGAAPAPPQMPAASATAAQMAMRSFSTSAGAPPPSDQRQYGGAKKRKVGELLQPSTLMTPERATLQQRSAAAAKVRQGTQGIKERFLCEALTEILVFFSLCSFFSSWGQILNSRTATSRDIQDMLEKNDAALRAWVALQKMERTY